MARYTTQGPDMRLPVRPAPAPPKVAVNGNNNRKAGRPPLQRRLTNVGIDWVDPWNETDHRASTICHSMSAIHISSGQDEDQRKKRTPPPRPPPPRFTQTSKAQNARGPPRNNQKSGSTGLFSAIFNSRRPSRKPQRESENRCSANGKPHRPVESSRHEEDVIIWETCPQKQRQHSRSGNKFNHSGVIKKSPPLNNGLSSSKARDSQFKTESPPPLLDLLTSSPPSSPVPSSRFGGSTGADTDSLSSDGFSKVGAGNSFTSAFPLDDSLFDPFGERINGGASSADPWAGEDPFTPSSALRGGHSVSAFEDPWITNSRSSQPDVYSQNPMASMRVNPSTMASSSSFTFGEQEDWPIPAVRSTTSSPIGNVDLLSSLDIPSSGRNESRSVSNPNIRNLSVANGTNPTRQTLQYEVPRTMNLAILGAMPTIIRAKPKPKERSRMDGVTTPEEIVGSSPPMPSVPPPPPPTTALLDEWDVTGEAEHPPDLPPRPWKQEEDENGGNSSERISPGTREQPHGVALFDYPATHADDLPFQTGDVILLVRKINDDWYYGRREAGGLPGMFPSTFIRPVIDLPDENGYDIEGTDTEAAGITWSQNCVEDDRIVKALFSFKPEVKEDLEFEEGDDIEVTGQLDSEWLWGRIGSKWGQFPASFVNRIPRGLPQHHP